MSPHDYGNWTQIEYHDGTSEWMYGHHFSLLNKDIDAIKKIHHCVDGQIMRSLGL